MGWKGRELHVSKLVLHAKQVYLMPQGTNPSSCTPFLTFVIPSQRTQPPGQTQGGVGARGLEGWWDHVAVILLHNPSHLCPRKEILLALFRVSAPFSQKNQPYTPLCLSHSAFPVQLGLTLSPTPYGLEGSETARF